MSVPASVERLCRRGKWQGSAWVRGSQEGVRLVWGLSCAAGRWQLRQTPTGVGRGHCQAYASTHDRCHRGLFSSGHFEFSFIVHPATGVGFL